MLPPVPKAEMPRLLTAATISTSLFMDLHELRNNSANKFFDSLAAGRPIMINYEGWQADLLRETGAGLVWPVDDIEGATRMLVDFLGDADRLKQACLTGSS